jgi:hypothetical protein
VIHRGPMWENPDALSALFAWIGKSGYSSAGPYREMHLYWRENDPGRYTGGSRLRGYRDAAPRRQDLRLVSTLRPFGPRFQQFIPSFLDGRAFRLQAYAGHFSSVIPAEAGIHGKPKTWARARRPSRSPGLGIGRSALRFRRWSKRRFSRGAPPKPDA